MGTRTWILALAAAVLCACTTPAPPSDAVAQLAPGGNLRAAINFGNPILARRDPAGGPPQGVSVDLARELASRLGATPEFVTFEAAGKVVEAARNNAWDIAFVAIDPARGRDMLQSNPYVIIEGSYLVAADSPIRRNEEVDRDGVRIAVGKAARTTCSSSVR